MKLLFFTATGNSLYIAKSFGGEMRSIPSMIRQGEYEFTDDKIGIVFPVYSNKVPQHVEEHLSAILADVNESKKWVLSSNAFTRLWTGNMVKAAAKTDAKENLMGGRIGNGIKNFATVDGCIGCATCAKVCPVDNITVDKESKTISFGDHCLSCFGCVHNCPTTAIHLKGERSGARYRNKNVTLKEIIEANNG